MCTVITGKHHWHRKISVLNHATTRDEIYTVGKKLSVKADLAIYSQAVDVRGRYMSESLKLGHNLDFSSSDIMVGFHKSSHI